MLAPLALLGVAALNGLFSVSVAYSACREAWREPSEAGLGLAFAAVLVAIAAAVLPFALWGMLFP